MRRPHLPTLAAAVVLLAAAGWAQATSSTRPGPPPLAGELEAIAAGGCELRDRYGPEHATWKASVRNRHEDPAALERMRAILRRLGELDRAGRCGG